MESRNELLHRVAREFACKTCVDLILVLVQFFQNRPRLTIAILLDLHRSDSLACMAASNEAGRSHVGWSFPRCRSKRRRVCRISRCLIGRFRHFVHSFAANGHSTAIVSSQKCFRQVTTAKAWATRGEPNKLVEGMHR